MGRKKKTPALLPDGWQDSILDLYREGASDVEIRGWISDHTDTFNIRTWQRWILDGQTLEDQEDRGDLNEDQDSEYLEFLHTIKKGRMLCQIWWELNGRKNIKNKEFNSVLWYMNMKNRFGWRDKPDDHPSNINISIHEGVID